MSSWRIEPVIVMKHSSRKHIVGFKIVGFKKFVYGD